jgi:hypothetical protein
MSTESGAATAPAVKIRAGGCDGCTLCCKIMAVPALAKPSNVWCTECRIGAGCGIYETRPTECRTFICGYLSLPDLAEEWKPAVSRLIISSEIHGGTITVFVDPARPDAWRRQPYYASLQDWSRRALPKHGHVVVRVGGKSIVVLPDHAVDLGAVQADEQIVVLSNSERHGQSLAYQVYAAKRDAWEKAALEVAQGNRTRLLASEGFRTGRRLD